MFFPPALLLKEYLISNGIGTREAVPNIPWTIYIGRRPDGNDVLDNIITIYDARGRPDGKEMRAPYESFTHPGIQIIVRAALYQDAAQKAQDIRASLDQIKYTYVTYNAKVYVLTSATTGNPVSMGQEEGNRPRWLQSLNGSCTVL